MAIHSREAEYAMLLNELLGEQVEVEKKARKRRNSSNAAKAKAILNKLSPKQRALADDEYKYISVLCPRRSGKSYAILSAAVAHCVERQGFRVAIFCLSKPHAKGVYWEDIVSMNEKHGLDIRFNATELVARFPNGSLLVFCGAESEAEISKVRGRKYHRVVLDESTVYNRKLYSELIQYVIEPALADLQGALWIAGTPKGDHSGEFYEATCTPAKEIILDNGRRVITNWQVGTPEPLEPWQWKFHRWTAKDNLALPMLWDEFLQKKAFRGWNDDNPVWRQEYLGEWVKMQDANVFRIQRYAHQYAGLLPWQNGKLDKTHFIMGADFGFHDGTALVIWAFVEDEPHIYEAISIKERGLTEEQIASMIRRTEATLPKPVRYRVGDVGGGGVLIMEGLKRTHGLHFEPAEKHDKLSHINYFNLALDSGLVRFRPGSVLMEEMEPIRWDEASFGTSRQREDRSYPNDLSDAALYAFRYAKARFVEVPGAAPETVDDDTAEKEKYCEQRRQAAKWRHRHYKRVQ